MSICVHILIDRFYLCYMLTEKKDKKSVGRPSSYTKEKGDNVCLLIATSHKSLRTIAKELNISVDAILNWIKDNELFNEQYARAKEAQADFLAEEMLDISEHTEEDHTPFTGANVIQRDRLRIETRKWLASKLKPKKYGEKLDLNHSGEIKIEQPLFGNE